MVFYCFLNVLLPALTSLFDEADTSNDGKISIDEYLQLTKNYGIEVPFFKIFIYSPVVQDHSANNIKYQLSSKSNISSSQRRTFDISWKKLPMPTENFPKAILYSMSR